ncbi:MAG: hypothetical protein JSR96_03535 [Proteobacteria bacterium]|nr:hypothetical protein [Pseudomonadota bacterium]
MESDEDRIRSVKRIFSLMGVSLLAGAGLVAWFQKVTIHGRRGPPVTYTGTQAVEWAGLFACIGIGLIGVNFRSRQIFAIWLGLWLAAGVATVLLPAFVHA